jgi:Uma2 family endonuclease
LSFLLISDIFQNRRHTMAQAVLLKDDGYARLAITVQMLEAMVNCGTIEDPARVELIGGELAVGTFVSRNEGRLKARLLSQLANKISQEFEVLARVSVRLNALNEPIPDICVARAGVTTDVLYPKDCVLVIEVSDATARKDRLIKAQLYAKAGIPEYWIVDLNTSETVVYRGQSEAGWAEVVSVSFAGELAAGFDGDVRVVVGP